MTIDEVFSKLATHMIEGLMFHDEVSICYDFIGLQAYAKEHSEHYMEESKGYRSLLHYYASHYHKLLKKESVPSPKLIPESWYKYTTIDVDPNTKRNAIKELMTKWIEWEKSTKLLYQSMRQLLTSINEVAAALELDKYILDVTNELEYAEKKLIKLNSINYDLVEIESWQQPMSKKYKKKLGW